MEFSRNTFRQIIEEILGEEGYAAYTPNWSIDVYITETTLRNNALTSSLGVICENPRIITKLSDDSNIWGCRLSRIQRQMAHFGDAINDAFEEADRPRNIALEENSDKFKAGVSNMLRSKGHFGITDIYLGDQLR